MAPPTFAKMYEITGDNKYLDHAIDKWLVTTDYLWDKKENLIYRMIDILVREQVLERKSFGVEEMVGFSQGSFTC